VTMADVKQAAADGNLLPSPAGGRGVGGEGAPSSAPLRGAPSLAGGRREDERTRVSASGKPMRTQPPGVSATGQPEQLKGVRRNMARVMAAAHANVVPTTLVDDADLHAWVGK